MKQTYHIGECPVCRKYGRMELYYDLSSGKISAICEECELEFDSADDYTNAVGGHRDLCCNNTVPLVRPAALEEIRCSEWYPLVTDK